MASKKCSICKSIMHESLFHMIELYPGGPKRPGAICEPCYQDLEKRTQPTEADLPKQHSGGIIYFVHAPMVDLVKIGHSKNAAHRLKSLCAESPIPLELLGIIPGTIIQEKGLHKRFENDHHHNEWFDLSDAIKSYLRECLKNAK